MLTNKVQSQQNSETHQLVKVTIMSLKSKLATYTNSLSSGKVHIL